MTLAIILFSYMFIGAFTARGWFRKLTGEYSMEQIRNGRWGLEPEEWFGYICTFVFWPVMLLALLVWTGGQAMGNAMEGRNPITAFLTSDLKPKHKEIEEKKR